MSITASDWTVDRVTGNIRYIGDDHDGASPSYSTVIDFHRWLQGLADDAVASGDDELDITNTDPSRRSTDNIITLINDYNITDVEAEHLYDGSIIYDGGDEIYDGIVNFGNADVQIQIIQDGKILQDDWWNYDGGGLNDNATAGISHRFMIKTRTSGADVDGRRLIGICRRFGYTYSEFSINGTARGNNVLALTDATDLNNETTIATVAGWTTITNTTVGYVGLDVDNNGTDEYYYSEWNRASQTINDFYERIKWLIKDAVAEDSATDTGSDFVVDNATITGAAQSFSVGANNVLATKATVYLKATGSPTGNIIAQIFTHSGTYGTSSVPNTQTGSDSSPVDSSILTTDYQKITFTFPTPVPLTASTYYCLVITHANGGAGDYVNVRGLATTGAHGGNRSHDTAGWSAVALDDLAFEVYTAPDFYGIPGNLFRGITHQVAITDLTTGDWSTPELLSWGSGATAGTGQLLAIDNETSGSATVLWMQLLTGVIPAANTITGATNSATGTAGTVTERPISKPVCGASTGSAIIGSYGFGIEILDLTSNDKVTSLANVVVPPPNYVINTVGGLTSGESYVLVAPWNGSSYDTNGDPAITKTQLSLDLALTTDNITQVEITESIPSDTPASGYIRVTDNDGFERRLHYNNWENGTPNRFYNIDTSDGNEDFAGVNASIANDIYIAYIDKLADASTATFTSVQSASRTLVVIVRDGGGTPVKQFISAWSQTDSNQTINAILTTDA